MISSIPSRVWLLAAAIVALSVAVYFLNSDREAETIGEASRRVPTDTRATSVANPVSDVDSALVPANAESQGADDSIAPPPTIYELRIDDIALHEMYEQYVSAADDGDIDAVAVIASILEECQNIGNETETLDELERAGLPKAMVAYELARYKRCEPLLRRSADLDSEYIERTDVLRDVQHPLYVVRREIPDPDQKRANLVWAILGDYPEPHVYTRAYMEAGSFHRDYPEHTNKYREEAWFLLACEVNWHCDSTSQRHELRTKKYLEHEYAEIVAIETSIRDAIQNRQPEALGFGKQLPVSTTKGE